MDTLLRDILAAPAADTLGGDEELVVVENTQIKRKPVSQALEDMRAARFDTSGNLVGPNEVYPVTQPERIGSKDLDSATVQGVFYPFNEGTGTSVADSLARAASMTVGGVTTGIWANSGWLTHAASPGNTLQIANDPYCDGLIDMTTDGSILIGCDFYCTAWPTATENLWAIHRSDLTGGGVRMPLTTSAGRIGVYYKSGGGSDTERVGYSMSSGYTGAKISLLTELRVMVADAALAINLYINGQIQRSNIVALGTPPAKNSSGGIYFSGYAAGLGRLGSSGAGTPGNNMRTKNCYVLRHSGKDRNIAARLARYVSNNGTLPSWLVRI